MVFGGHSCWVPAEVSRLPEPNLPFAAVLQTLTFSYLPLTPSSPVAALLWSSTLHAISWSIGKGFSQETHGTVRSPALQQQLRGQKGPCAMTETLGARPGIYMVICISADKKELSAPQLGWQYFFPHCSCLDISERVGAPQGHCKIEKTIKRS